MADTVDYYQTAKIEITITSEGIEIVILMVRDEDG